MSHYLLDTNHISPLVTATHPLRERIIDQIRQAHQFSIAVPALAEMLFGISILPRARQNLAEWQVLSFAFSYFDISKQDAEHAAELQTLLRKQGWQLGTVDALIAAIALRYELVLLTTDGDFKKIPNLQVKNWLEITTNPINQK